MFYEPPDHLYHCWIDGRVVFLDLRNDAYFLLRGRLKRAFSAYVEGQSIPQTDIDNLIAQGLLVESGKAFSNKEKKVIPRPIRSAAEEAPVMRTAGFTTILEVAHTVYSTRRRLRTQQFKDVIDDHLSRYSVETLEPHVSGSKNDPKQLMDAANEYTCARRYVPVETSCLLDSLAMHRFLWRRQLFSSIVFGVTVEPFSAHSWLQSGDISLNESVSYACTHTPILVL